MGFSCDDRISRLRREGWTVETREVRELTSVNNCDLIGWDVTLGRDGQQAMGSAGNLWTAIDRALAGLGQDDGFIL
jgi:hypothetical protein